MQESLLKKLPPVQDKTGWPWTKEVDADLYNTKENWPKISIVTPSYNQGQFIEETIRSILLQNYPNLEYIIIDGGSTDDTVAVIKKYEPWITFWVSEKDTGQANAINKGVEKCTGQIFNWINSDDLVAEQGLYEVASLYHKGATIAGQVYNFYDSNSALNETIQNSNLTFESFLKFQSHFHQPGIWCDFENFVKAGKVPETYAYYFDRIFLTKYFLNNTDTIYTNKVLTHFRFHETSKTTTLYGHYDTELIAFYKAMLIDPLYKQYRDVIKEVIDYKIRPDYKIFQWKSKQYNPKSLIKNIITYAMLAARYPKILGYQAYYVIFKHKVLGLKPSINKAV